MCYRKTNDLNKICISLIKKLYFNTKIKLLISVLDKLNINADEITLYIK